MAPVFHPDSPTDVLREAFSLHAHALLVELTQGPYEDDRRAARSYLTERGFDLRREDRLPIGFFPSAKTLRERLLRDGFTAEELHASGLLSDGRLPGRLVGPIRDARGRIVSFWAKPRQPGTKTLYLDRDWKTDAVLFGLDTALPAVHGGKHDLLLVEDVLDALLLSAEGLPAVAALGGVMQQMTEVRWERLAALGVYRVTLASDRTGYCSRSALAAIDSAARARFAPAVYLLPPEVLPEGMGPAEIVRSLGPEALLDLLVRQRMHGLQYKALRVAAAHKQGGPWAPCARRAALREAADFYAAVHQRAISQLDAFFLPALLDALDLGWDEIGSRGTWSWEEEDLPEAAPAIEVVPALETGNSPASAPAAPPPSIEAAESAEPVAPSEALAVTKLPADPPPERGPTRLVQADFCAFHRCARQACWCWD